MGASISKLFASLFGKKETKILMLGLDAAGKTTILYKLKLGETVNSVPTIGFNVETVKLNKITLSIWDVPVKERLKPLLKHYFPDTHGFIFVIDTSDRQRIDEAKQDFIEFTNSDDLKDVPLLVFANKKDIGVMTTDEICEKLELYHRTKDDWHIQESNALTGEGLIQGLDWLGQAIKRKS